MPKRAKCFWSFFFSASAAAVVTSMRSAGIAATVSPFRVGLPGTPRPSPVPRPGRRLARRDGRFREPRERGCAGLGVRGRRDRRCYPRPVRRPPVRRYFQVGIPLAVGAIVLVPLWFARSNPVPAETGGSLPTVVATSGALPAIRGPALSGGTFGPLDPKGAIHVVVFWNPDCPPCRREAPALAASWRALRGRGVDFVGVMYVGGGWPDDRGAAQAFARRYGLGYPQVVDTGSSLARAVAIPGIPVTVVADASGSMRYTILGGVHAGQLQALIGRLSG